MKIIGSLLFIAIGLFIGILVGLSIYEKGHAEGNAAGKAEVQTPAYIVNQCSTWWMGSEREAKKMIDKYCEVKK